MAFVRTYGFSRAGGNATTKTLTGLTMTVGDLAVLVIWWYNNLTDAITVTDSAGNTWTKVPGTFRHNPNTGTPNLGQQVWTAPITSGGTGITITATFPATAFVPALAGIEYSGRDNANPIDSKAGAQGLGVASSGSITTLTAGCDLFGCVYDDSGTITGQGTGWSIGDLGFTNYMTEERVGVAIGSYAATSNSGSTVQYNAQIVALRAPAPPVTAKPVVCIMQ